MDDIKAIAEMVKFLDREPSFVADLQEERLKERRKTLKRTKPLKVKKKKKTVLVSSLPLELQKKVRLIGVETMSSVLSISLIDDLKT